MSWTLGNPKILREARDQYVPIKIDGRRDRDLVKELEANWAGDLLIIDDQRNVLTRFTRSPAGTKSQARFTEWALAQLRDQAGPGALKRILAELDPVLARYALSDGPVDAEELAALTAQLDDPHPTARAEAARGLIAMGRPAHDYLQITKPASPEARRYRDQVLSTLEPLERLVQIHGLDRLVPYLAALDDPAARRRLADILPSDAPAADLADWWKRHGTRYRFDAQRDRYVAR